MPVGAVPCIFLDFVMKKTVLVAALLGTVLSSAAMAQQQPAEGSWMVRARAVHLDSNNGGSTNPDLGLSANNKWLPEVDFTYFYNKNLAVELILTVPQKHTLYSHGGAIGTFKHLPPTLSAQYHFSDLGKVKPYLGAGVNYTRLSSVNFAPAVAAALSPSVDKNSFGLSLQAGVDIHLKDNMYLNLDIKKVQIRTDVSSAGNKIGQFKVDPVLIGVGLGWRF